MDWGYKVMLTATIVALLLVIAQIFGRRLAGVLAGLPTVTGPALLWLALENVAIYAFEAGLGSVVGCALCALFAFAYVRASRSRGPWLAAGLATVASVLLLPAASLLVDHPALAASVALGVVVVLYRLMPAGALGGDRRAFGLRAELLITSSVAGVVSGAVTLAAPDAGPFWAGVLASPPLIAAVVAMQQQVNEGPPAAAAFLRGYVGGLIGRIGFGTAFALLPLVLPIALAATLAFVASCLLTVASMRWLGRRAVPVKNRT